MPYYTKNNNNSLPVVTPAVTLPEPNLQGALDKSPPGRCCGCCCNYRLAVMIVAGILAVLELLLMIFVLSGGYSDYIYGDSHSQAEWDEFIKKYEIIEVVFSTISVLLGIGAIAGALKYNAFFVGVNALWIFVSFVAGIVITVTACSSWENKDGMNGDSYYDYECTGPNAASYVISFVIIALIIYPHVGFIVEVKKGILAPEVQSVNYDCNVGRANSVEV